jgi:hypothetical protein
VHAEDEGAYFFVETAHNAGPVSACYAYRSGPHAHAHIAPHASGNERATTHFIVRELPHSSLCALGLAERAIVR